jgi:uncharacterized membrane protein YfbV (UPF0208 family)|tara:strand:+ start:1088 stop:1384 length:297 start_codon:yes stop_codon:yes gene_type:complete
MSSQDRKKIANIYVNPQTHATLKALAAHQETSLQGTAAEWLEEVQPMMQQMVEAFDAIKSGKNAQNVMQNFMADGLKMAGEKLKIEEENNVTDNGQSN